MRHRCISGSRILRLSEQHASSRSTFVDVVITTRNRTRQRAIYKQFDNKLPCQWSPSRHHSLLCRYILKDIHVDFVVFVSCWKEGCSLGLNFFGSVLDFIPVSSWACVSYYALKWLLEPSMEVEVLETGPKQLDVSTRQLSLCEFVEGIMHCCVSESSLSGRTRARTEYKVRCAAFSKI